jgi:hypothetical protein
LLVFIIELWLTVAEEFRVYRGDRLPDGSEPTLLLVAIDGLGYSRLEHYLLQKPEVAVKLFTYHWRFPDGTEAPHHSLDQIFDDGLQVGVGHIVEGLLSKYPNDPAIIRHHFNYQFHQIADPRSYVISQKMFGRLPPLTSLRRTHHEELRSFLDRLGRVSPIKLESADGWEDSQSAP